MNKKSGSGRPLGKLPDGERCMAQAKGSGRRCQNPRVDGYAVCRTHGAGTRKRVKDGRRKPPGRPPTTGEHVGSRTRYGQLTPDAVANRLKDPEILSLTSRVARMEIVREIELGKLQRGEWDAMKGPDVRVHPGTWLLEQDDRISKVVERALRSIFRDEMRAVIATLKPLVETWDQAIERYVAEDQRGAFREFISQSTQSTFVPGAV